MTRKKPAALMQDEGIIRNRLKIAATIDNAKAFLVVQRKSVRSTSTSGPLSAASRSAPHRKPRERLPAQTAEAEAMSKDLKKRGFRFVGPTICYAFMQAVGMVDDHSADCFRAEEIIWRVRLLS